MLELPNLNFGKSKNNSFATIFVLLAILVAIPLGIFLSNIRQKNSTWGENMPQKKQMVKSSPVAQTLGFLDINIKDNDCVDQKPVVIVSFEKEAGMKSYILQRKEIKNPPVPESTNSAKNLVTDKDIVNVAQNLTGGNLERVDFADKSAKAQTKYIYRAVAVMNDGYEVLGDYAPEITTQKCQK